MQLIRPAAVLALGILLCAACSTTSSAVFEEPAAIQPAAAAPTEDTASEPESQADLSPESTVEEPVSQAPPAQQEADTDDPDQSLASENQPDAQSDASWTSVEGPEGLMRVFAPIEWDQRRVEPNGVRGTVLEATTNTNDFELSGLPGIRLTTGYNIGSMMGSFSPEDVGDLFGPARNCESTLVESTYESAILPGRRFDYTACGANKDLTATFIVLEPSGSFSGAIVEMYAGPESPTVESLMARIEVRAF